MNEKSTFAQRLAVLCYSNLGLTLLGFFYRIFLSRMAGAEGLGVYRLVFSVYIVIQAASLSGVTMACTRLSAAWMAQGKFHAIRRLVRTAFVTFFTIFGCCALIVLTCGDWIGTQILGDERTIAAMPVLLICIGLTGVENIFKSTMIGINRVENAAVSEVGEQIIRIASTMALLYCFPDADLGLIAVLIFAGWTISECFSATLMTAMYARLRLQAGTQPPAGYLREFAQIVAPVSVNALLINAVASADAVILPQRLVLAGLTYEDALSQMGIVSGIAMPILFLPMALVSSLATIAMPEISRLWALGNHDRTARFAQSTLRGVGLIGIPATALLMPLAPTIARLFFYQPVRENMFAWLGCSVVCIYFQMITAGLLNGTGHQKFAVTTVLTSEILQLGLVWMLASQPAFGIDGYLIAMCVAPLYVTVLNLVRLCQLGILRVHPLRMFGVPLLCGAVMYLWTRVFLWIFLGWFGQQWLALSCAAGSAILLYVVLLRLFGIRIGKYLQIRSRDTAKMFFMY